MKAKMSIESRSLLPNAEDVPELPSGETTSIAAEKQWCSFGYVFALAPFPTEIFVEFISKTIGQQDLLVVDILTASFENPKLHATADPAAGIENIADIKGQDFMLPKTRA